MTIYLIGYASTPEQWKHGLQGRTLRPGTGMLFVYTPPMPVSFWNHKVSVPLDVIFMDQRGIVTGVASMERLSMYLVPSPGEIRYALEVPGGTAQAASVMPGQAVRMTRPNVVEIGS